MLNLNFKNIADSYLFSNVNRKVAEYGEKNPGAPIIRLGIGDVTLPLAPAVIEAMQQALCEMFRPQYSATVIIRPSGVQQ